MADTLTDILIEMLEKLTPEELERFKFLLTKEDKPLARGRQGTTLTQLVQGMERAYTDKGSIETTQRILKKMDLCDLVKELEMMMQGRFNMSCPSTSSDQKQGNLNFFNKHKEALETRMSIRRVLIRLEGCGILNAVEREDVEAGRTDTDKNRALIVLLSRKGDEAQEKFYQILKETDPYLVQNLEK